VDIAGVACVAVAVAMLLVGSFVAVRDCELLPLIIASRGTHINLGV